MTDFESLPDSAKNALKEIVEAGCSPTMEWSDLTPAQQEVVHKNLHLIVPHIPPEELVQAFAQLISNN